MRSIDPYIDLLAAFVERGELDALAFDQRFADLHQRDQTMHADNEFAVLDELFGAVDAFEPVPEIRQPDHLDDEGLRAAAAEALVKLRALTASGSRAEPPSAPVP